MIHDPKAEVTCDGPHCREREFYDLPYRYRNMSESSGHYDLKDEDVAKYLRREEWVVEGEKTYCSESCRDAAARAVERAPAPAARPEAASNP